MAIEFRDDREFVGVWFVTLVANKSDWLCAISRPRTGGDWTLVCRFRYWHSPDPFDNQDIKSWHEGTLSGEFGADYAKAQVDRLVDVFREKGADGPFDFTDMRGCTTAQEMSERFARNSYCHMQTAEEAAQSTN